MINLFVMVGLPGSGKSYKAEELSKRYGAKIFSSDTYRKMICGDESEQGFNAEIFERLYFDLNVAIENGQNCIFDATNVTLKSRKKIFDNIDKCLKSKIHFIAYVVNTPIKTCVQRDAERERTVGFDVINKFYQSYQHPQKFEGFDEIIINEMGVPYRMDAYDGSYLFEKMKGFDQYNPHHIYTLDKHCERLANAYLSSSDELCKLNNPKIIKYVAGLFHDVGKLYTQKFDDNGIAHYYNHDCVGAYELTSNIRDWYPNYTDYFDLDGLNETLFYVNYHMRAHKDFLNPKAEKKYRNIFGDERFDSLIEFAENDKKASGTYEVHDEILEKEKSKRD